MAHENELNLTNPLDIHKAGLGAQNIRDTKEMFHERLAVDHNMDGVIDEGASQDGTHKQVTLKAKTGTPSSISGAGIVYSKNRTIDSVEYIELCYLDGDGNEVFITEKGVLAISQAQYLLASDDDAVSLGSSYGSNIAFSTEDDKVPDELIWDNELFVCSLAGFYLVSVMCNSSNAISLAIYLNDVSYTEWDIAQNEGTNNNIAFIYLSAGDSLSIRGKSISPTTSIISTRKLHISRV